MKKSVPYKIVSRLGLLFLLAIIGAFPPQTEALPVIETIQPDLLQIIDTAPESIVSVIVQQKLHNDAVVEHIRQLRGKVTKNLPIIHAFAAELPAWQVTHLAQNANIRWISLDGPVVDTECKECVNTHTLVSAYNRAIRADQVWNEGPYRQGQNVTVAVVDSGVQKAHPDFGDRMLKNVNIAYPDMIFDGYGHGTYVAGIIGGNGNGSKGAYVGVAPKVNLLDVRVTSMAGAATESDVVAGLQWIYDHRAEHNIRVVNLSFNASQPQSYHTSPLNAACEILWFNGVVVVAAAGNHGMGAIYPPANDPFVITVGAADDKGTATLADDQVASFSAYGVTPDGVAKPDLIAPGRNLVGPLNNPNGLLAILHPQNILSKSAYFRMSGTSAAAPVVSGAIALLLQAEPLLTPDQIKQRLLTTANKAWSGYDPAMAGAGYLDIYAAIHSKTLESANTGLPISKLLQTDATESAGQNKLWDSVTWSTVTWSSDYWEADRGAMRTRDQVADDSATMATDLSVIADENQEWTLTKIFLPVVLAE